jgi:hypothetical protein
MERAALTKADFGVLCHRAHEARPGKDALPWFERQARNPHNHAFLLSYADALGQAGQSRRTALRSHILAQIRSEVQRGV